MGSLAGDKPAKLENDICKTVAEEWEIVSKLVFCVTCLDHEIVLASAKPEITD